MGDKKKNEEKPEITDADFGYMEWRIKVLQDERAENARKSEDFLRQRIRELDGEFEKEGDNCRENTGEMSRQYKEMQESFNERIGTLQKQVAAAKHDIETVTHEIERVRTDKDEIIRQKELEIKSLSQKMETMAFEFADMLKETLDKMSQRIEVTHNSWDRDSTKPPLMNRLKAFSLTNEAAPAAEK